MTIEPLNRSWRRSAGVVLAWCTAGVVGCSESGARAPAYSPPADVPRPLEYTPAPETGLVVDFDMGPGVLYLLEPDRVQILRERNGAWEIAGAIGRAGGGPGEFGRATGITSTRDGFAVTEMGRVQFFSTEGEFLHGRPLTPPCMMTRPVLVAGARGHFLQGSCLRRGFTTDTVKAVLAWSADTASWQVVTDQVHYTRDGSLGSPFSASTFFSAGSPHHLFGTGYEACLTRVVETDSVPQAREQCGLVDAFHHAPPPPEVAERLNERARAVGAVWPEHLPAFIERVATAHGDVMVRPFSTDSVVLQAAGTGGAELMVMPFEGLIGCRRSVCLWLEAGDPGRMMLLSPRPRAIAGTVP